MALEISENGVTVKCPVNTKGKYNPKTSVFREFALATAAVCVADHRDKSSNKEETRAQFSACDLTAHTGLAGLQWKCRLGDDVHVTLVELREPQQLKDNAVRNGFSVCDLALTPRQPAGGPRPSQSASEVHVAQGDGMVVMLLEAFNFIFIDSHKYPSLYFSSLFRNIRNGGVACIVVPDVMHFARAPHVTRRHYGASCIKTEYIKELATRIVAASLAGEAAKRNKGVCVLYAVSVEDALLIGIRVTKGPKIADAALQNVAHLLHCRICEERVFYPENMAPVESPYSLLDCDCHQNIPGKTAVVLGPLWKGSLFDWLFLQKLAEAGRTLNLSKAYMDLLEKVMEDCLCSTPPVVSGLQPHPSAACDSSQSVQLAATVNRKCDTSEALEDIATRSAPDKGDNGSSSILTVDADETCSASRHLQSGNGGCKGEKPVSPDLGGHLICAAASELKQENNGVEDNPEKVCIGKSHDLEPSDKECRQTFPEGSASDRKSQGKESLKRQAADVKFTRDDGVPESKVHCLDMKSTEVLPSPPFYYSVNGKKLSRGHLPKQKDIIQQLRALGYQCCRTHYEKYAIRTDASRKRLMSVLGFGEAKLHYVKKGQTNN